jgi:hypothetical protein
VTSLSFSLASLDQFHEENGGQNSDDIFGSDVIYHHQGTISSPENTQNNVQNHTGDGSNNSDDIFGTEGEDRAARLKEYDRLSALSRKKSKDAEKVEEGEV